MIVGGREAGNGPGATLDDLFRRAGVRRSDALALLDPPNRASVAGGAMRRLTYAQADRAISALAARLRGLGLPTDAVVALHLPNTAEAVIALLGVMRAGMIAAPMPMLWRQHDIIAALGGVGVKAIITGSPAQVKTAMLAAAELFPIRHVCAFGSECPDGVVPLDDIFSDAAQDFVQAPARNGQAAAHAAVITFDVTGDGYTATTRNHLQLIAGGLVTFLEAGLAQDAKILSTLPPASFAGLALGLVPWLIAGGALELHHGCEPDVLAAQCKGLEGGTVVLPGPALAPLAKAGVLGTGANVIALWRAPERLAATPPWRGDLAPVDVAAFGEVAIVATRRVVNGKPASVPRGRIAAPRSAAGAVRVLETARSRTGTLMLRGPMVPAPAVSPGTEATLADAAGFVDTGFACRKDGVGFVISAPPAGITSVGGYRFRRQALEALVAGLDPAATLMAVPDAILGERLAGDAPDLAAFLARLDGRGVNPLVCTAFRARAAAQSPSSLTRY